MSSSAFCPLQSPAKTLSSLAIQKPHLLTTYSHLPNRDIVHTNESMVYHSPAPMGVDLNYGFERRVERDPEEEIEEHLDGLCQSLKRWLEGNGKMKSGSLVTWRGMMARLLTAAYEKDSWEMNAVALGGNVYLENHVTPEAHRQRMENERSYAKQSYHGYSFESFSTSSTPRPSDQRSTANGSNSRDPPEAWSGDVNTNVQWCCVVKSGMEDVRLIMGGEVDCVQGEWTGSTDCCVELKTNMIIRNARQQANFERKLLKHWAQSYLLGIPRIVVGFRDQDGILKTTETFETLRIPRMISTSPNAWNPHHCLTTFRTLTQFILHNIIQTDVLPPSTALGEDEELPKPVVWRLSFRPGEGLGCEVVNWKEGEGRWAFLREDYVKFVVGLRDK